MNRPNSNFYKYIFPVIVGGLFTIAGCIISAVMSKGENQLASRETTETRNLDGSVTKREMEIYK
jgi:hypothetical protein